MTGRKFSLRRFGITLLLPLLAAGCAGVPSSDPLADGSARALELRLADATMQGGAPDTTLHVADEILAKNPRDVEALLRKGRALLVLQRPADAAEIFDQAVAIEPASVDALTGLAEARSAAGEAPSAETAWRAALTRSPGDARLQCGLAVSLDLQGRHAEAQTLYRQALASAPDLVLAQADLGLSLAVSGHPGDALPLLRQAAQDETGPLGTRARHNLAVGLELAGDEAGARAVLTQDLNAAEAGAALAGLQRLAATGA